MTAILIGIFLYIIIGMILYYGQEEWVKQNDEDFFEGLSDMDYIRYFLSSVLLWLPMLIAFWIHINKNKNNEE